MRDAAPRTPIYTSSKNPVAPATMPCKAQLVFVVLIVILGSMQILASCGQKGDLYLPEDAPEERR